MMLALACARAFRTAPPRSLRTRALSVLASTTEPAPAPVEIEPLPVLYETPDFAVIAKPAGVPCHHSDFVGSHARGRRSRRRGGARSPRDAELPTPVLQRARETFGKRVNLVHRIDQPTSGCLLISFHADASRALQAALSSARARKTYFALCRGEGTPLRERGTFVVDGAVRDEKGVARDAETELEVLWGSPEPRCCLVRARPRTGRYHQIRRHLKRESFPILGDTSHGDSRENVAWRARGLHRLALHLHRLELRGDDADGSAALLPPGGLDVTCPLPDDFRGWIGGTSWDAAAREGEPALFAPLPVARARAVPAAAREAGESDEWVEMDCPCSDFDS